MRKFCICLLVFIFSGMIWSPALYSADKDVKEPFATDEGYLLNIKDADMAVLLDLYSRLTEKAVLPSSEVSGKVNIINRHRISRAEAIAIVESVLELNGFSTVIGPTVIKVVAKRNAVKRNIFLGTVGSGITPADRVETHLVGLKNIEATNAKSILAPLLSDVGNITIDSGSNVLVLTEVASNSSRLVRILRQLDVSPKKDDSRLAAYSVKYAPVQDVVKQLQEYFKSRKGDDKSIKDSSFMGDKRLSSILVTATNDVHKEMPGLLKIFDRASPGETADSLVIRLSYAKASNVAQVLTQLFTDDDKGGSNEKKKIQIVADEPTNTLIISADSESFDEIRDMIKTLDIRPKQVLVKAIIMEVSLQKGSELGISWTYSGGNNRLQSNMGTPISTDPFSAVQNGLEGLKYAWFNPEKFAAIFNAIVTGSKTNILSSPHIMTVDNKSAEIRVGQEIPYTKDSRVSDNSAVIKTNEYRKVGVTLKVTPRITESQDVLIDLEEEISGLLSIDQSLNAPIFFSREAKATVIVRSGHTIVIGGLIRQENKESSKKVPILGDLPLIKNAFRYKESSLEKTELIAFITPVVIGDDGKAERVTDILWEDFRAKIKTKSFKEDMDSLFSRVTKATVIDSPDFIEQYDAETAKRRSAESNSGTAAGSRRDTAGHVMSATYIKRLDPPLLIDPQSPYNVPVVIKPALTNNIDTDSSAGYDASGGNSLSSRARQLFSDFNEGGSSE
jgi:general secretion pathway protein D